MVERFKVAGERRLGDMQESPVLDADRLRKIERRVAGLPQAACGPSNGKPIAVPLNATALAVLRRQFGKHPEKVFTYAGKPLGWANTKAWRNALKRAGIDNFRWHDLRHTWASWHRQSGTPTHELQRLGGWRSSVMVERYAHLAPDHLASAAGKIDALLGSYDLATPEKDKGPAMSPTP